MPITLNGSTGITAAAFDGTVDAADLVGILPALNGAALTNLSAANLTGNLPAINGSALTNLPAPTTAQVSAATAAIAVGDVGSYAYLTRNGNSTTYTAGTTLAGSNLLYANANGLNSGGPGGTWRCMGYAAGTPNSVNTTTLWLRIS